MIYYISDLHIGHKNAIRFDNRPFTDIDDMEQQIIARWNTKVTSEDDIYILGDIFYHYGKDQAAFLHQLQGRLHLIPGNHDYSILKDEKALACFQDVEKIRMITDEDRKVVLCHFPIIAWNKKHHGTYHVYGHVHAKINRETMFMMQEERAFNAGCMINGYEPCTLAELEKNNRRFAQMARDSQREL